MMKLSEVILDFDHEKEVERIASWMRETVSKKLRRRGVVVAVSGGIDSSVSAALAVRAFGADKVFALLLPEKDSSDSTQDRGKTLVDHLGVKFISHDIEPTLDALGCYKWRDSAIKEIFPDYCDGWKSKIVIAGGTEGKYNHFRLVVQSPASGEQFEKILGIKQYLQIVAATNYKQRIRKTIEYFHADRLNYSVIGTPNRVEYDQGFFVKNGDGSADLKPIAHLYKTQVYSLAKFLGLPRDICNAIPTTDTYSLPQGQDEFYFSLPYEEMDVVLWAYNHGLSSKDVGKELNITEAQVEYLYKDIESKRSTTAPLHWPAVLIEPIISSADVS